MHLAGSRLSQSKPPDRMADQSVRGAPPLAAGATAVPAAAAEEQEPADPAPPEPEMSQREIMKQREKRNELYEQIGRNTLKINDVIGDHFGIDKRNWAERACAANVLLAIRDGARDKMVAEVTVVPTAMRAPKFNLGKEVARVAEANSVKASDIGHLLSPRMTVSKCWQFLNTMMRLCYESQDTIYYVTMDSPNTIEWICWYNDYINRSANMLENGKNPFTSCPAQGFGWRKDNYQRFSGHKRDAERVRLTMALLLDLSLECPLCLEPYDDMCMAGENATIPFECGHMFCVKCLRLGLAKDQCAVCRCTKHVKMLGKEPEPAAKGGGGGRRRGGGGGRRRAH